MDYRSVLFTPGHQQEMFESAFESQADALILDLEDAVPPDKKESARTEVVRTIAEHGSHVDQRPLFVRVVNPQTDIPYLEDRMASPYGYWLPKMETGEAVEQVADCLGTHDSNAVIIPMVENGAGVINAPQIAQASRVEALAFGGEDYTAAIGATPTSSSHEIQYARQRLVAAADAANVGTIDTVYTDFSDIDGLEEAATHSMELGYDAKPAIHPSQVETINRAFTPSEEEVAWAKKVLAADEIGEANDVGAVNIDGEMIDDPLVNRARSVIARAEFTEEQQNNTDS